MWVKNRVQKDLIAVTKSNSIKTVIDLLGERKIYHLLVLKGKELVDIITERDVRPFHPALVKFLSGQSSEIGDLLDCLVKGLDKFLAYASHAKL